MTGSGRAGTGAARYRRNRAILLSASDLCALCLHPGARTADHKIPDRLWPRDARGKRRPGFDELGNLQPAHGTMGGGRSRVHNRCPTCGKLCNQSKGDGRTRRGAPPRPSTREWL